MSFYFISKITDELYISRIIVKNIAKRIMNIPITVVVPQPGATFPYSELRGFNIVPNGIRDRPRNKYDCWSGSWIAYPSSALFLSCIWLIQCSLIVFKTQKLSVSWWNHHDDDASYVFLLTNWVALFIRKHVRTWLSHVRPVYRLSLDHFRHLNYRWASGTGIQKCCRSRLAPFCGLVRALYKDPAYSNWTWRQKRQKKEE